MKITKKITINKPLEQVWDLVAHQFDKASLWMGPIPKSEAIGLGKSAIGAPMQGRMCDLSENPKGAKVKEVITHFSEQNKSLTFNIYPVNNPAIIPIKQNTVSMNLRQVDETTTEVIWLASPQLKLFAYPFYPLLRLIFPVAFGKLLTGLKEYCETSLPLKQATV